METGNPQGLTFFNRTAVAVGNDGGEYRFSEEDFKKLNENNYWHNKQDPSTWLTSSTVSLARAKFNKKLKRPEIIALCAATLNITPAQLEHALDWNANYLAFHDGTAVEENHSYLPGDP